jgi:hypothetical protein
MSMRRTPPLSIRGSREVFAEMALPPADTPERRATFDRVRAMANVRVRPTDAPAALPKPR